MPNESREAVVNHINSFPHYISHYKRETSSALYLNPSLNVPKMYELFKLKWSESHKDKLPPSQVTYNTILKSMNLKFKPLKTDTCKNCDILHLKIESSSGVEQQNYKDQLSAHQEEAEFLQKTMRDDLIASKTDVTVQALAFDL